MSSLINPATELSYLPISRVISFEGFDCNDADLNDFIINDAIEYHEKQLSRTTCIFYKNKVVGFYSLSSDSLRLEKKEKRKLFSHRKNYIEQFPSIKLARMALDKTVQRKDIGSHIIELVKGFAVDLNENGVAVRFITVDAYSKIIKFYQERGFVRNSSQDSDHTVSMRLDLFA